MNEWKSCFFPGFFFPPQKSNEWMTFELFHEKKRKKTRTQKQKMQGKKNTSNFKKKRNFIKIWLNDRWTFPGEIKKSSSFFSTSRGKNTFFWFEWINKCPTSLSVEKNYSTFDVYVCIEKNPCTIKVFWVLNFGEVGDPGVRKPK